MLQTLKKLLLTVAVAAAIPYSGRADLFTGSISYEFTELSTSRWLGWPDGPNQVWGVDYAWEAPTPGVDLFGLAVGTTYSGQYSYESPTMDGEFYYELNVQFNGSGPFGIGFSRYQQFLRVEGGEITSYSSVDFSGIYKYSIGSGASGTFWARYELEGDNAYFGSGTYQMSNPVNSSLPPPTVPDSTSAGLLVLLGCGLCVGLRRRFARV